LAWLGLAWLGLAWLGTHSILYTQPLKMELTEGSETSANHDLPPGKYPKEYTQSYKFRDTLVLHNTRILYILPQILIKFRTGRVHEINWSQSI
jgi:hypothetical protein